MARRVDPPTGSRRSPQDASVDPGHRRSAAVKLVLDEDHSATVRRTWNEPVELVAPTIVDPELAELARSLAATRPLCGMDAVYLATASRLSDRTRVGLLTFDTPREASDDELGLVPAAVNR